MRQFAAKGLRIWNLAREAKLIYSFFCGLSLLAMLSSLLLYEDLVGPSLGGGHLRRIGDYYADSAGSATHGEATKDPSVSPSAGGPAIALPSDEPSVAAAPTSAAPGRLTITVPYRKLLEVTHFHLFTVPVFLLILTHLFLLTGLSRRAQGLWIWLGWLSATLHIATPWIVRAAGPGSAWLHAISGLGFLLTSLALCVLPLWQMWWPPTGSNAGSGAARRAAVDPLPRGDESAASASEAEALDTTHASRVDTP